VSRGVSARVPNAARTAIPIALGFVLYAAYAVSSKLVLGSSVTYEESLASNAVRLLSVPGAVAHVRAAYVTSFYETVYVYPLLLALFLLVHGGRLGRNGERVPAATPTAVAILLVGALPLLSTIYLFEPHMRDLDRVLYPVSVGFVLVMATASFHWIGRGRADIHRGTATSGIAVLLIASFFTAANARESGLIQDSVLTQTLAMLSRTGAPTVLLRDETGRLGDIYTLYQVAFEDALFVSGAQVSARICTPGGVDRLHDVARRFPIPSTPRCEELEDGAPGELVLSARWHGGRVSIDEAGRR
jgi:hypothetical protein